MRRETVGAGVLRCPDPDELSAFDRGLLPAGRLEAVADHLTVCEECESILRRLSADDVVQSGLRRRPPEVPAVDEAACRQIEDRARVIPLEEPAGATVSDCNPLRPAPGPRLPAVFGRYVLLEQLGQGGMGVVYKARQEALKRVVALKMVRAGAYAGTEERMRFRREGEAIARVRHANVIQIHEFGEHDGQLFFSMELLEGGTLAGRLGGRPMPEREAAELVRALVRAVQAAHAQGVVHRDLKPGNVLFAADGTAKVTDFGLAKVLDDQGSDTRSDAILGTPAYMAPEQARGEVRSVGPAADVWALGAILYECLTGRPPFKAETRSRTLELVRADEPAAPSRLRPGMARDLEAICLKCLERDPNRRYPSAEALADDLTRWLAGEPTKARPIGRIARLGRTLRRRPQWVGAAALLVVLIGGCLATYWWRDPDRPRREIERRLAAGEKVTLIGATGKPTWFTHLRGGKETQLSQDREGTFKVHSWSVDLLELVPDPQSASYRFEAEVRHDDTTRVGKVGLFFGHRQYPIPEGTIHCYTHWEFNDIIDAKEAWRRVMAKAQRAKAPEPEGNRIALPTTVYVEGETIRPWGGGDVGLGGTFTPAGLVKERPFRRIAVEVRPSSIRAFWEDERFVDTSVVSREETFTLVLKSLREHHPDNPFVQAIPRDFTPRGGLGLYVFQSSASFRNVVVQPLDDSK